MWGYYLLIVVVEALGLYFDAYKKWENICYKV